MTEQSAITILDNFSEVIIVFDRQWRCTYVNAAAERLAGHSRERVLGKMYRDAFRVRPGTAPPRACLRAMTEGVAVCLEELSPALEQWFEESVFPSQDGIV